MRRSRSRRSDPIGPSSRFKSSRSTWSACAASANRHNPAENKFAFGGVIVVTTLLIIHGLIAVVLLGGLTHQAAAACWPAKSKGSFLASFRGVAGVRYTTVNIVLYIVVATLGAMIYPTYRLAVRPYLES